MRVSSVIDKSRLAGDRCLWTLSQTALCLTTSDFCLTHIDTHTEECWKGLRSDKIKNAGHLIWITEELRIRWRTRVGWDTQKGDRKGERAGE